MSTEETVAGYKLIEIGALVDFRIVKEEVQSGPDEAEFGVKIELLLEAEGDGDEPSDIVEWAAFGFIFTLAALSFEDARPRGASLPDYDEDDRFRVFDLFEGLRFEHGELHYHGDYVQGRRMKTTVVIRPDGSARLATVGRGKAALRWLAKLQGKRPLGLVGNGASEA